MPLTEYLGVSSFQNGVTCGVFVLPWHLRVSAILTRMASIRSICDSPYIEHTGNEIFFFRSASALKKISK